MNANIHIIKTGEKPDGIDIFNLPVHPMADIFPMLADDELAELANDISENGLRHPLVIGLHEGEAHLVDGRNRREACRIVHVEPAYRHMVPGEDIAGLIYSENITRRHMTSGQRAMATALMFPETSKGGRGNKNSSKIEEFKVASGYLSMARTVLSETPEMANSVLAGKPLKEAYDNAVAIRKSRETEEQKGLVYKTKYPDLHKRYVEGDLTLDEMATLAEKREAEKRRLFQLEIDKRNLRFHGFEKFVAEIELFEHPAQREQMKTDFTEYRKDFEDRFQADLDERLETIQRALDAGGIQIFLNMIRGGFDNGK